MTTFRHIELSLDTTYAPSEQKHFTRSSRCICNYLETSLASLLFQSPYSRLIIHCSRDPQAIWVKPLKRDPFLEVCIKFDLPPMDSLTPEALQRQFIQIILSGLESATTFTPMPVDFCLKTLRNFESGGFVNRWLHLDKRWERWKCRCTISAELTTEHFSLDQLVYVDGHLLASRRIAETKPREGLFVDYLGDISISSQGIIKYKKGNKVLTAFDLQGRQFVVPPPTPDSPPSAPHG